MKGLQIAMVCGALCLALEARAQLVNLSWTGTGSAEGVSLSGELNTTYNRSDDQYAATSTAGFVTITGNSTTGFGMGLAGQYTLEADSMASNTALFNGQYNGVPQGYLYDDQLNLNSPNFVDSEGLLLIRSDGSVVNIYLSGGRTYMTDQTPSGRVELLSGDLSLGAVPEPIPTGAVPEPATMIAGVLMLLPLAISAARILCRPQIARTVGL